MFTISLQTLKVCVCLFRTECSQLPNFLSVCIYLHSTHCMGIYTQLMLSIPKDPIDGPKDHLSSTFHSKDQQGPRRMILRGLTVEPYLSSTSKDQQYPSRLSFDTDKHITTYWPSQTRRIVDLVNLQTNLGHRLHTDRIQTKYRHKCTNKLPLGCSFVFIFYSCRLVSNFDGLWSSSYQNSDVLSSLHCRRIFKVFTS
ncbi:hypothetical protein HanXRQr2_Chr08g0326051 [Helianthus annuus]|uniref:Uncharacterized protein n=1 Tax=Helianthus annuus TaxID=4232 RepID=A0A9K3NBK7_HELAN|nr:hypothetical protein HanXRQr2_Chr08g0326051 [Helianthus annuus]